MIFLDTSYLVALAMPTDELHQRAIDWSRVLEGPFLTTNYVICEFFNSLSSPNHKKQAHALLAALRQNRAVEIVTVGYDAFNLAIQLHEKRFDKSWSLTDCISFDVMKQNDCTVALTHDHHFEQAGHQALLRSNP